MACPKCSSRNVRLTTAGFAENEYVCLNSDCRHEYTSLGSGITRVGVGVTVGLALTVLTGGMGAGLLPVLFAAFPNNSS